MALRRRSFSVLALTLAAHGVLFFAADGALLPAEASPAPVMALSRLDDAALVSVGLSGMSTPPASAAVERTSERAPSPAPTPSTLPLAIGRDIAAVAGSVVMATATDAVPAASQEPSEPADIDAATDDVTSTPAAEAEDEEQLLPAPEPEPMAATAAAKSAHGPHTVDFSSWPAQGSIQFRVLHGASGFQVGEAKHRWSHNGKRYEMETVLQTTGLTAMLREFHYVQRSVGTVGRTGLRPERFTVEQNGKKPERAEFDWSGGRVTITRKKGARVADIHPGDQDILSLWHQIGLIGTTPLPLDLTVVSNKAAAPSRLSAIGMETVQLPIGKLDTQHLRAAANDGRLIIDLWLARRYGMLPVRIRVTDDKGDVFDQQAVDLRLSPSPRAEDESETGGEPSAVEMVELREELPALSLYE